MPIPDQSDQLRDSFLRYVTGKMKPEEALSFEERLLADHAFSDAAALCEQELIDGYAAGEQDDPDRTALSAWIKASPRRMQRLRLARSLQELGSRRTSRQWGMGFVLPIAAVLAGLAVLTMIARRRFEHSLVPAQNMAAQKDARPNSSPLANAHKAPELMILLVAERVRGELPVQVVMSQPGTAATLQLLLPEGAADSRYRIRVEKDDGDQRTVLDNSGVNTVITGDRLVLIAHLPEGVLTPGPYTVTVDGTKESFVSQIKVREPKTN